MIKFGLIPEFIGRVPVVVTLDALDENALDPHPERAEELHLPSSIINCLSWMALNLNFEDDALERGCKEISGT